MKYLVYLILIAALFLTTSCEKNTTTLEVNSDNQETFAVPAAGTPIENSYIVVFKDDVLTTSTSSLAKTQATAVASDVMEKAGVSESKIVHIYSRSLPGFSATISENEVEQLKSDERVKFIEQDMVINGGPPWSNDDPPVTDEVIPWGITRVGGGATYTGSHVAWVIDSGIDLDHPDLNVDASRGAEFIDRTDFLDDDNGHGTHVAGTIGAIDNDIFVIGVAAGATVIPVKVLDRRGSGSTTGVIAGIEWVADHGTPGDVANMSLGGGISDALDQAVVNAAATGIYFALAAGNESDDANLHSPARAEGANIFTVSAFGEGDLWASFSNYGNPPVDYAAPGVGILSLYKSGGSATLSGTSMASPHVAGLLLATGGNLSIDGYVINDPDGTADPIAHR